MSFDIIIVECPYCGARKYGFDLEETLLRLKQHKCLPTMTGEEISEIVGEICNFQEVKLR